MGEKCWRANVKQHGLTLKTIYLQRFYAENICLLFHNCHWRRLHKNFHAEFEKYLNILTAGKHIILPR